MLLRTRLSMHLWWRSTEGLGSCIFEFL